VELSDWWMVAIPFAFSVGWGAGSAGDDHAVNSAAIGLTDSHPFASLQSSRSI
jgi:hypothetical protein